MILLKFIIKELSLVAGYAGDALTSRTPTLRFSPELGFARAVLAHAQYTIDTNRSVALDAAPPERPGELATFGILAELGSALAHHCGIHLDPRRCRRFPGAVPSQFVCASGPALQLLAGRGRATTPAKLRRPARRDRPASPCGRSS